MSQLHNTEYHMAPGANVGVRLYDLRDMPCRPEEIKEGEIDKADGAADEEQDCRFDEHRHTLNAGLEFALVEIAHLLQG